MFLIQISSDLFCLLLGAKTVVNDCYRIFFGILIVIAELRLFGLLSWFSFLKSFIGLGGFYIFVGGLALDDAWYEIMIGKSANKQDNIDIKISNQNQIVALNT